MVEFFGKIYKSINDILADNLIVVVILPAIFYIINRIVEKCDDKYNVKKENVYIPLYNMFEKFSEEYIIPEFKKDFTDLDFKVWDDICSCENKLFVDPALKNLMKKFLSHRNVFSKKWEDAIEVVVEQYNDMTEKID